LDLNESLFSIFYLFLFRILTDEVFTEIIGLERHLVQSGIHNSSTQDFWANFVFYLPNFGEKLAKFGVTHQARKFLA